MAKLTKTQKEFRKKMKELAKEGKLTDEFGNPIKVKYYSSFNLKNILLWLLFICIVLYYIKPFWHSLPDFSPSVNTGGYSEQATSDVFISKKNVDTYLKSTNIVTQYANDTNTLITKYQAGQPYSITEITAIRNGFSDILPSIENNCKGTDEIKEATVNRINANIAMLNFLEKNLGLAKTTGSVNEHNSIIAQLNTTSQAYMQTLKTTLSNAGIDYYETDNGIEYSYKTLY